MSIANQHHFNSKRLTTLSRASAFAAAILLAGSVAVGIYVNEVRSQTFFECQFEDPMMGGGGLRPDESDLCGPGEVAQLRAEIAEGLNVSIGAGLALLTAAIVMAITSSALRRDRRTAGKQ